MHLQEIANHVTQEVLNSVIEEMHLSENAANSLRAIAEAIENGMSQ